MEWKKMIKEDRQLSEQEVESLLKSNKIGQLGTFNNDGSPYVISMNYAYSNGRFILHSAKDGHKIRNILNNNKVCFTVSQHYQTTKSNKSCSGWHVQYKSVIAFGRAIIPEDENKKALLEEFTNAFTHENVALSEKGVQRTLAIVLEIEHITGKRGE